MVGVFIQRRLDERGVCCHCEQLETAAGVLLPSAGGVLNVLWCLWLPFADVPSPPSKDFYDLWCYSSCKRYTNEYERLVNGIGES